MLNGWALKKEKEKKENLINSSKKMGDSRYRALYLCSEGYALMPYATRTKRILMDLHRR